MASCVVVVTSCNSSTPRCNNGGLCVNGNVNGAFSCECVNGFSGATCDEPPHSISSSAAASSSSYGALSSSASLTSAVGVNISSFERFVNACVSAPCDNGGRCNATGNNTFSCECVGSFAGSLCADCMFGYFGAACASCPLCLNGGRCDGGASGSGKCLCAEDYAGATCEQCADGLFGARCTQSCPPCVYGVCDDGEFGTGECVCTSGFIGALCDQNDPTQLVTFNVDVVTLADQLITITLNGSEATPTLFYSRILSLPASGTLYQTTDGITPSDVINSVGTMVTDSWNRVIYQPPLLPLTDRTEFVYIIFTVAAGVAYAVNNATATITIQQLNSPPKLTVPFGLTHVLPAESVLLPTMSVAVSTNAAVTNIDLTVTSARGQMWYARPVPTSVLSINGPIALINAALANITYTAPATYGLDTLTITIVDNTNQASNNVLTHSLVLNVPAVAHLFIAVDQINQRIQLAPNHSIINVTEYASVLLPPLIAADVDMNYGVATMTVTCQHGVISLQVPITLPLSYLTFEFGTGSSDRAVSVSASLAHINVVLSSLMYAADYGFVGNDSIQVTVNDNGNTGVGGATVAQSNIVAIVSPVVQTPTLLLTTATMIAGTTETLSLNVSDFVAPMTVRVLSLPPTDCARLYAFSEYSMMAAPLTAVPATITDTRSRLIVRSSLPSATTAATACEWTYDVSNAAHNRSQLGSVSLSVVSLDATPDVVNYSVSTFVAEDVVIDLSSSGDVGGCVLR